MQSICIKRVAHPIAITPPHTKVKGFSIWAFKPDQRWKFIVIELMFYAFLYEIDEVVVDVEMKPLNGLLHTLCLVKQNRLEKCIKWHSSFRG